MSALTAPTKDQVLEAIASVNEPNLGKGLVELKMIPDVEIDGRDVTIHIELGTPISSQKASIAAEIRAALATLPDVENVDFKWSARVRSSAGGRSDAQPIKGVKNTIAVASGKGGVGKSTVAVNIAVALAKTGAAVGLLDADVYGPSIPLMMGVHDKPLMKNNKIVPLEAYGVKLMSIGFILDPDKALIWRGPLVAQLITQFLNDVDWGDLDYLVLDLPPGTGDVAIDPRAEDSHLRRGDRDHAAGRGAGRREKGPQDVRGGENADPRHRREHERLHLPELQHGPRHLRQRRRQADRRGKQRRAARPDPDRSRSSASAATKACRWSRRTPIQSPAKAFDHAAERVAGRLFVEAAKKPRKPTIMLKTLR